MPKKLMIISGATGFIGSNIVNGFHFDGYDQVLGVSSKYYYSIIKNKKIKISKKEFNKVTSENVLIDFLHLATFLAFKMKIKKKYMMQILNLVKISSQI